MAISEQSIEQEIMKTQQSTAKAESKDSLKELANFSRKVLKRLWHNKEKVKILIPIAIISVLFMIYMITKTIINIRELNNESNELYNLNHFNIKSLENNDYTKENIKNKTLCYQKK